MPTAASETKLPVTRAPNAFDVLAVPYPFTGQAAEKRRPAVALPKAQVNETTGHTVCAMITSADNAACPHDLRNDGLAAAGLPAPSVIRLKWLTIDNRLILRRAGTLGSRDRRIIRAALDA